MVSDHGPDHGVGVDLETVQEGLPGPRRGFWVPPQNGRFHLHMIDQCQHPGVGGGSLPRAQAVLQGVAFTGLQVLRQKRLLLLHEKIGNVSSATTTTESLIWWIIRCYI